MTDNPLYLNKILPLVGRGSPATSVNLHRLKLDTLLVKTTDPSTLERVRTYLATDPAVVAATDTAQANAGVVPETFGESAAIRAQDVTNVQHLVLAAVLLTLIIASCSLAVTVGGGLLERRRPFTLLRLGGTSLATLRRVVLLESALPLVGGAIVAVAVGLGVATPFTRAALPATVHTTPPSGLFFLTTGAGVLIAVGVVAAALPLLARVTDPAQARFE
jgi:predicted lysophospholipase L1 biosynthesis ABC-type transport system permease subunit